jgi:hypothetical protein
MPAQWPVFINNVSSKLASKSAKSPDDIGTFIANEYFNAVKTAQTPFGNIHEPGQKSILETGFKKAFNILFNSLEPQLEDKFGDPLYDDMLEKLPGVDLSIDTDCDFEEWTIANKSTITPFEFYPLFPTTCIIPKPIVPETNLFGDIDVITPENFNNQPNLSGNVESGNGQNGQPNLSGNAGSGNAGSGNARSGAGAGNGQNSQPNLSGNVESGNGQNAQPNLRYVTMSVIGGDGTSPYEFTYSLNGEIQPVITSDSAGVVKFLAPTDPGKYEYTFISAMDASKLAEIKNINKSASIEIKEDLSVGKIKVDSPQAFQLVKPMSETDKINSIADRVLKQNDGTIEFLNWVKRISYNDALADNVSKKVIENISPVINSMENSNIITAKNASKNDTGINDRLFQEEYTDRPDSIPDWITSNTICAFTYIKEIDDDESGAPDKNPIIVESEPVLDDNAPVVSPEAEIVEVETFEQWSLRTEPIRLNAKIEKYNNEKLKYADLKIRYINQKANKNKKTASVCGANDAYCVMSKCILDYWKSTAVQPFAAAPAILPCLIPSPGNYIPIYYGDEAKLGADLRKAWNTGKKFKLEPTLKTATKAVAAAVAVSCAKHLKDLKFIYNGQIPTPGGPVPMIGLSPTAF